MRWSAAASRGVRTKKQRPEIIIISRVLLVWSHQNLTFVRATGHHHQSHSQNRTFVSGEVSACSLACINCATVTPWRLASPLSVSRPPAPVPFPPARAPPWPFRSGGEFATRLAPLNAAAASAKPPPRSAAAIAAAKRASKSDELKSRDAGSSVRDATGDDPTAAMIPAGGG